MEHDVEILTNKIWPKRQIKKGKSQLNYMNEPWQEI